MAGDEAEDRTLGPSKQRLQRAREQGQVAHSPELTAAAGLLAAVILLGCWGDDLAVALIGLLREHLAEPPRLGTGPVAREVVAWLRHLALAVALPLAAIVAGVAAAAFTAHQIQVGGLWAPRLLTPDPARLWPFGRGHGPGLSARWSRGAWALVKGGIVVALAVVTLRAEAPRWQRLGGLEPRALAVASAGALRQFTLTLATATLALGLLDFGLQRRRYALLLQMTPEEHREDLRTMEGDPALRAQRRRIARTWRTDPSEVLTGAALILTGTAGLTVVVAGGPPPRRLTIRAIAQGPAGLRLRQAAAQARVPEARLPDAAPALARRLANHPASAVRLAREEVAALAALWPLASEERGASRE
jgi:flagellar biosynthetic protein FlhB